jgi:hypothetical protein
MIQLTKSEQTKIRDYAERFLEHKKGQSRKQGGASDIEYDLLGFTGEYIVHKYFNKPFEWDFDKRKRFDDIVLLHNDKAIVCDIKSSYSANELRVARWHIDNPKYAGNVDAYILVRVNEELDGGEIRGIISKKKFKEVAQLKMYRTACYCVNRNKLSPLDELYA